MTTGTPVIRVSSLAGVAIDLPVAGPGARAYAFTIDIHIRALLAAAWAIVVLGIGWGWSRLSGGAGGLAEGWAFWVAYFPALLIYLLYHPVLEFAMKGMTPGKRFAGVRLVTEQGGVPGAVPILVRNLFRLIDSLPSAYAVGFITTLVTRNNVRFGDLAAGTVLVYFEKQDARDLLAAESLSRSERLTPGQAAIVQDLLERWKQLDVETRLQLARRVLETTGQAVDSAADEARLQAQLTALLAPAPDRRT